MALAEATVRVTLEVSKFERDLRQKVTQAANNLLGQRFLVSDDVQAYVSAAAASSVAVDATAPSLSVPAGVRH